MSYIRWLAPHALTPTAVHVLPSGYPVFPSSLYGPIWYLLGRNYTRCASCSGPEWDHGTRLNRGPGIPADTKK